MSIDMVYTCECGGLVSKNDVVNYHSMPLCQECASKSAETTDSGAAPTDNKQGAQ